MRFLIIILSLFIFSCDSDSPTAPTDTDYQSLIIGDWEEKKFEMYDENDNLIVIEGEGAVYGGDFWRFTNNTVQWYFCTSSSNIDENCYLDETYNYQLVSNVIECQQQEPPNEDGYIDYEYHEIIYISSDSLVLKENIFNELSCSMYDNCNYGFRRRYFSASSQ